MSMDRRATDEQNELWIPTQQLAQSPGHPFYRKLKGVLARHGFDRFVEVLCDKFYAEKLGRPSVPPGVYFRMLMVGYFEGLDSERGIDWRCADSLALREFLGYSLKRQTPDHSTLSRTRERIDLETHQTVFTWVLKVLAEEGLLKGKTIGVDATTLEANAAMRSIVRRDGGEGYEEFLKGLAKASGIQTPTREDLSRLDRKRDGKASNDDWEHPHDPDARVAKMKDGRTHMAHKAEHAVDLDTQAVVAVTVQGADWGDTSTIYGTVAVAAENLREVREASEAKGKQAEQCIQEVVADKGYHSNDVMRDMREIGIRTYVSEPARGARKWEDRSCEQAAVYANRRRIRGARGGRLRAKRAEVLERTFAHSYETGGMRRTHLRGQEKILKRLLIHICGLNLSLLMRKLLGAGTPRGLQETLGRALESIRAGWRLLSVTRGAVLATALVCDCHDSRRRIHRVFPARRMRMPKNWGFSTGC
jgi:transposase